MFIIISFLKPNKYNINIKQLFIFYVISPKHNALFECNVIPVT